MPSSARKESERRLEAARGYLMLDMPDHALRELHSIEDPEEHPFAFHQLRGEALREKGEHHAALKSYRQALAERPTDLAIILGMAWCYKRIDELPKAIAVMKEAYELASEESIVLYNLACYLALAGEKTEALSWLGRSLRMDRSLRRLIPDEPDFDPLRDDPDFQLIINLADEPSET